MIYYIMKSDLVNLFNRLTSSELADYTLFSDVLDNHYEKVKYLYSLIDKINLNKIEQIYCTTNKNTLRIVIEPQNVSHINDIVYKINNNRNNYIFSDHFKLNIVESKNYLLVEISTKDNKKEGDMYASRFI